MTHLKYTVNTFKTYLPLLYQLVVRDVKVRYRRSVLGILWTVLNPLLMMTVMTVIFSTLFKNRIDNFALYYLTGFIMYTFFNESTTNGLHSVVNNSSLMKKVYIPKYLFPVSNVVSSLVNFGFSFIAMLIVMIVTRAPFHVTILLCPIPVCYLFFFCTGMGMILSAMFVFFRDIGHFYGIITLVWMYITPMFYPVELLKENGLEILLQLNPLFHYISYFRALVLEGTVPGVQENLICIGIAVLVLLLGMIAFYRKQDRFILYV